MSADKNILTITEPDEGKLLEKFDVSSHSGVANIENIIGSDYPGIVINGHIIPKEHIQSFTLDTYGELPILKVSFIDSHGVFINNSYPRDGDTLKLRIRSNISKTYKDIRIDFDITNVNSPIVNERVRGGGSPNTGQLFKVTGIMKIPGIYADKCRSFKLDTSFNHIDEITKDLGLGFASNVNATVDEQIRIQPYCNTLEFLREIIEHTYSSDDSFFTMSIDPYYYFNLVDVNKQFNASKAFEESKASLQVAFNTLTNHGDDVDNIKTPLLVTNLTRYEGSSNYISGFNLVNNGGEISILDGYERAMVYYDWINKEQLEFTIKPLLTESPDPDERPLTSDRAPLEIKKMWCNSYTDNVHVQYNYSPVHNHKNLVELEKMYLEIELDSINAAIYKYQKLPVILVEKDWMSKTIMEATERQNQDAGVDKRKTVNKEASNLTNQEKVNFFLSGHYVVAGFKYTYTPNTGMKQKIKLWRREWPANM